MTPSPASSAPDPAPDPAVAICWMVSDGRRGIENQALGLAEAVQRELATPLHIERVTVRKDGFVALPGDSRPDLWIGCGRAAIPLAASHRRIFPDAFFAYVQDPRRNHDDFDLIIAPDHDRLRRPNAVTMLGSPNRVTADRLAAEQARFADRLDALPGPRAAVLIGGPSKRFKLDTDTAAYLERRILHLLDQDVSLMITVSRRTPQSLRSRLAERLVDHPRVWLHDAAQDNPYFAFLAAADWIFVTEESTNMLVEAAATGTPVYALPMAGQPGKFAHLHAALEGRDALRPYLGRLEDWSYAPLDETRRIARTLIARWQAGAAARPASP
ncbi:mitochondrial fission ELM1 family protein [Maricaulis sp. CAU 1757]